MPLGPKSIKFRRGRRVAWGALLLWAGALAGATIDYAEARRIEHWLQHPVYGGPSFDSFVHSPQNPLHRGTPPLAWPVNSFFFADPVGGNWYIYVGEYPEGYATRTSRCLLLRSNDRGRSWTNLGVVLQGSKEMFDEGGATPDVSIVFADGRYHMVYDWAPRDRSRMGGLAYAWAEKPEGPFYRAPDPITRNQDLAPLLGKYRRTYAATLLRREHDWMIIGLMDRAPNSWALFGMTALKPEGPYGERVLLRNVETDGFLPPLLEFYPTFVHGGFVYAPATSVALNRDYNALYRAPLENALEPTAWTLIQNGSIWHADDVDHENYGMWGQTFSGWVDERGMLQVSFHSRDSRGAGTVNVASRPWDRPMRDRGFVLAGHQGPNLALLRQAFAGYQLDARLRVRGTIRLVIDYDGVLGPNRPESGSTLHPLAASRFDAVELTGTEWKVIRLNSTSEQTILGSGIHSGGAHFGVQVDRRPDGETRVSVESQEVWRGTIPPRRPTGLAIPAIIAERHSHLTVERFAIAAAPQPAALNSLFSEALLGAGESRNDWREVSGPEYRFGLAVIAKQPNARAKWNVTGRQFTLWSPRGPEFGLAQVKVDGQVAGNIDLHDERLQPSRPVWRSGPLPARNHAVVLTATAGALVVDSLEFEP